MADFFIQSEIKKNPSGLDFSASRLRLFTQRLRFESAGQLYGIGDNIVLGRLSLEEKPAIFSMLSTEADAGLTFDLTLGHRATTSGDLVSILDPAFFAIDVDIATAKTETFNLIREDSVRAIRTIKNSVKVEAAFEESAIYTDTYYLVATIKTVATFSATADFSLLFSGVFGMGSDDDLAL